MEKEISSGPLNSRKRTWQMGLAGIRWNFKEIPFTPCTTENNQRQERIALIFPLRNSARHAAVSIGILMCAKLRFQSGYPLSLLQFCWSVLGICRWSGVSAQLHKHVINCSVASKRRWPRLCQQDALCARTSRYTGQIWKSIRTCCLPGSNM